jgi:signal transduction histidine kinase
VSTLLENLLIWAQSQVNKIEYRPTKLLLNNVFLQAINGLKQSAEDKEIEIRVEGNKNIMVLADPDMVQIIMRNILGNAIKFTRRGGSVVLKQVIYNESMVLVSISDNGVGIEKSQLTKLFDITNKYHTQGTENEKSTGLGLILVKEFVEKNKGTLSIESEKDKGTTVMFTLPLAQVSSVEINS